MTDARQTCVNELEPTVSLLLSPQEPADPDTWRRAAARRIRDLVGADAAVLLLWTRDAFQAYPVDLEPRVMDMYLRHYASPERGVKRLGELGIEVWSGVRLWDPDGPADGAHDHGGARPPPRCDTLGLSVHDKRISGLKPLDADARLALLYSDRRHNPGSSDQRLTLLNAILPVFRTGLCLHLHFARWLELAPSLLDRIGQRLALFSLSGQELYRNAVLRRTLGRDPDYALVEQALGAVARAAPEAARGAADTAPGGARRRTASRDVDTRMARYRLRGSLVGPEVLGAQSAVLVSIDRLRTETPSPDMLGAQYGLTAREVEIATLLAQRFTNDEIAKAVGLSPHTTRHHTESVLLKVGVHSRRELREIVAGNSQGLPCAPSQESGTRGHRLRARATLP